MNRFFSRHQIPELAPAEAWQRLGAGALLIDVREPSEWRAGHVHGARHVPLGQLAAEAAVLAADQEVLLICQSGRRSADAVQILQEAGFTRVASVAGGTAAWRRQGLPLARA